MREQILELLRTDPEFRDEVRRLILTEDLLALPSKVDQLIEVVRELAEIQRQQAEQISMLTEAQRRTEERLEALAEAQSRTEKQVEALAEAQKRTEERLEALAEAQRQTEKQVEALAEAQRRTEEQLRQQAEQIQALIHQVSTLITAQARMEEALQWLINWQRGEMGRREGERYERHVIRRAPILFNGGEGGSPLDPSIQRRLTELLPPEHRERLFHDEEGDPFLADLVWWKEEQVAVVEISLQVDGYDVIRASQRAATLRQAGVQAIGIVIGREWANPDAYDAVVRHQVEWLIGTEMSEGFRRFRGREA